MGTRISRRRLFAYSALVGAAATAAYSVGWWWFKTRKGDTEDLIVSVLRRHLRGLPVLEEDLRNFAQTLQPRFAEHARLAQLGMFGALYESFDVIRFVPGSAVSFRHFEDLIVGDFLLSTDFFSAEREATAEVQYYGARDTERLICNNPFANFDE